MDKQHIADTLYAAIVDVSPFAADLLASSNRPRLFSGDTFLVSLGINSIDYAQIAHIVMDNLNINCTLEIFTKTNSVEEIIDLLYQLAAEKTVDVPA